MGERNIFARKFFSLLLLLSSRGRYVAALDYIFLCFSVYLAYSLRLTFILPPKYVPEMFMAMFAFSSTISIFLIMGGTYKVVWTRASIEEYTKMFKWYCLGLVVFFTLFYWLGLARTPRSSLALMMLFGIGFMTGLRALWKLIFVSRRVKSMDTKRTLIIGAGEAGALIARDINRNPCEIELIGFVDDNPNLKNMSVASVKVLGDISDLRRLIEQKAIQLVLIAIPSASGSVINEYIKELEGIKVEVRILPSIFEIADGNVGINRLRNVQLEDLLRREAVKLDNKEIEKIIKGKRVLVTGAGGSIGSEICRQIANIGPAELIALGHGEQSIYELLESFEQKETKIKPLPVIADVADPISMKAIFEKHKPQVIFHAAAHKHVPLMEENPREALRVNSYGTSVLADLCGEYSAERMVLISTDKAVNPTSVMGGTKRIAEKMLFNFQQKYPETRYMAVRFGNVLGSRGSVIPKFERQIERGGPVTVTHPDMSRYFMLIPEAVSLVLQAGSMGFGGELFVLDMGEPVNILEMAETLIKLHGYEPYEEVKIEFNGIRPGEKLYEELFYDPDHVDKTANDKIYLSKLTEGKKTPLTEIKRLLSSSAKGEIDQPTLKEEILELAKGESQ